MAYYNPAQEQPQVQYQAPIVYYAAPTITYQQVVIKHYGPYYKRETSTGLGATQIVLACISATVGVTAIVYAAPFFYVGVGIWAAAFYLIAGSLAAAAGKDPTDNLITATLVFSVFDIVCGITQVTVAGLGLSGDFHCNGDRYNNCDDWLRATTAVNSMMIGVGCLEIIFGVWLIVVSARAIDEGSKAQPLATIPVTFATTQPETVFIHSPSALQHQPQPPPYFEQPQYPSISAPQQMMCAGVHQAPSTNNKSG